MIPPNIKIDYFFKEIANELGIPVEDVTSVYRHYRKHIEEEFKTKVIIDVYKFGRFIVSPGWTNKHWNNITKRIMFPEITGQEADEQVHNANLALQAKLEEKIEKISQYEKFGFAKEYFQKSQADFRRDYKQHLEDKIRRGDFKGKNGYLQSMSRELDQCEEGGLHDTEA